MNTIAIGSPIMKSGTAFMKDIYDAYEFEQKHNELDKGTCGYSFVDEEEGATIIDDRLNIIRCNVCRGEIYAVQISKSFRDVGSFDENIGFNDNGQFYYVDTDPEGEYYYRDNDFWSYSIKCNKDYWDALGITDYPEQAMLVSVCKNTEGVFDLVRDMSDDNVILVVTDVIQRKSTKEFFEFLSNTSLGEY